MEASPYDRPMGRALEVLLASFGLVLGALVIGSTLVVLAVTDPRPPSRPAPAVAAPPPAPATPAPPTPVQQAQQQVDALVPRFAQSLDTAERAALLVQIRQLAATPGVVVPYR